MCAQYHTQLTNPLKARLLLRPATGPPVETVRDGRGGEGARSGLVLDRAAVHATLSAQCLQRYMEGTCYMRKDAVLGPMFNEVQSLWLEQEEGQEEEEGATVWTNFFKK